MTQDSSRRKRMNYVPFPEAPVSEEGIAAVLITKHDDGDYRAYVEEFPGREGPDPEIVAALKESTEIRNL